MNIAHESKSNKTPIVFNRRVDWRTEYGYGLSIA